MFNFVDTEKRIHSYEVSVLAFVHSLQSALMNAYPVAVISEISEHILILLLI
jgi:hypothetical protein